jgi:hypothetical protein
MATAAYPRPVTRSVSPGAEVVFRDVPLDDVRGVADKYDRT